MEKYIVKLEKEEREHLLSLISKGKTAARKQIHARILLEADNSSESQKTDEEIASLLHVGLCTVRRVRKACVLEGIEAALERKSHSRHRPRKIQGEEEAHLIALCCSDAPEGRNRWTLKLLADKLVSMELLDSISPQTVGRALKKMN